MHAIARRTPQRFTAEAVPDLLVVSPAYGRSGLPAAGQAQIVLLPGAMGRSSIRANCAVTYGMSGRDTLTLSSVTGRERILSLQREILTVRGEILERQELTVRGAMEPERLLAVYGALLLLGEFF